MRLLEESGEKDDDGLVWNHWGEDGKERLVGGVFERQR